MSCPDREIDKYIPGGAGALSSKGKISKILFLMTHSCLTKYKLTKFGIKIISTEMHTTALRCEPPLSQQDKH